MPIVGILPYLQIALAVLLCGAVLLQQRGAGLGGAFGSTESFGMGTRRGLEKWLFFATIALAVLFAASAVLAIVLK